MNMQILAAAVSRPGADQVDQVDAGDTEPARLTLWAVELEADLGRFAHTWRGYACNSIDAGHLATDEVLERSIQSLEAWRARGLRVRSCAQVGV